MIDKLKRLFGSEPEVQEYEVKAGFETEDGREYERGDTVSGFLRDWDNESLGLEVADKRQMIDANTAPVYSSRELQYDGEYIDRAVILPSEWVNARSGKVLIIPGGGV
jgi:hypothetical protein